MPRQNPSGDGALINVRKLAALDIAFHGPILILAEFGLGILIAAALAAVVLYLGLSHGSTPALYRIVAGVYFLSVALNYLPLLLYALSIARRKSARVEAAYELEHPDLVKRKYGLQSLLLFLPLVIPLLAIAQELRQRTHRHPTTRNTDAHPA